MKQLNTADAARWAVPGILGLLLVIFAKSLTSAAEVILGIGLILAGATGVISWWQTRAARRTDGTMVLIGSVLGIGLGLWILTHLHTFDAVLKFILGALLILAGGQWLLLNRRTLGLNLITVLAGLSVVLGIVILFTKSGLAWPLRLVGIGLMVNAACGALGFSLKP